MAGSLLFLIPDETVRGIFTQILQDDYTILFADNGEQALALLRERRKEISSVLLSLELARENNYALVRAMDTGDFLNATPLIAVSPAHPDPADTDCLKHGLFELISARTWPAVVRKRVENAIRAKDSVTFSEVEKILKRLPSTICLKDREGRYVFATHYGKQFKDEGGDWSIRGKTDLEVRRDENNARLSMEADRRIIASGKGEDYILEETSDEGVADYYQIIKQPLFDEQGEVTGIVALINNVTEQQLLKKELEKQVRIDALTGILNKHCTEDLIRRMLENRMPTQQDAMLMIDLDDFKSVNDRYGHAAGDWVLSELGCALRSCFRAFDVCGRIGGDEFMVFLRDIEAGAALRSAQRLLEKASARFANSDFTEQVTLSVGIALCPAHGTDFESLYRAADHALYHVKENGKGAVCLYAGEE